MNKEVVNRYAEAAKQAYPSDPAGFARKMSEVWNTAADILSQNKMSLTMANKQQDSKDIHKPVTFSEAVDTAKSCSDGGCGVSRPEYTGDICPSCRSPNMVTTGSCSTCQNCGETSGCG